MPHYTHLQVYGYVTHYAGVKGPAPCFSGPLSLSALFSRNPLGSNLHAWLHRSFWQARRYLGNVTLARIITASTAHGRDSLWHVEALVELIRHCALRAHQAPNNVRRNHSCRSRHQIPLLEIVHLYEIKQCLFLEYVYCA